MTATIGRVGGDVTFDGMQGWDQSGDRVSVRGFLKATTTDDLRVLRQQLSGYVNNPDEPVVPVTWSYDPTVDGFYRVTGVDVSAAPVSAKSFLFPFTASLERVAGYAAPLIEPRLSGALRVNSHAIVVGSVLPIVGFPSSATDVWTGTSGGAPAGFTTRTSADGAMRVFTNGNWDSLGFAVEPADFYVGAATIEVGDTLRTVVGDQITNEPTAWRLSNGLVRVTPGSTAGRLDISHYDGSAWDTAKSIRIFGNTTAGNVDSFTSVRVMKNAPEGCVIRLGCTVAYGFDWGYTYVDLRLRRGDRNVEGCLVSKAQSDWGVALSTAEACTAQTGGIRATANDASSNRIVLAQPDAITSDLVNGSIRQTAASYNEYPFMVSSEIGGSGVGGTSLNLAQNLIYTYMAATGEQPVVVTR